MTAGYLLAVFVLAAGFTWVANWTSLGGWRRSVRAGAHWTEQARVLYPARLAAAMTALVMPINAGLLNEVLVVEGRPHWFLVGLAALLGASVGSYAFDRETVPGFGRWEWLRQFGLVMGLRFSGALVLIGAVAMMPRRPDWTMLAIVVAYLLVHLLFLVGAVRLLAACRVIDPAPERLDRLARGVAASMGANVSGVWVMDVLMTNAFAHPASGDLIFSRRLVELLTEDELRTICAHEVGHLRETKGTVALRFFSSLTFFPLLFLRPAMQAFGLPGLLLVCLGVVGMGLTARWVSRRLEVKADRAAVAVDDKAAYARALERLHEAMVLPAVFPARQQTHPNLYDRMEAAGVTPGYPRPKPPRPLAWHGRLQSMATGLLAVACVMQNVPTWHRFLRSSRPALRPASEAASSPAGETGQSSSGRRGSDGE